MRILALGVSTVATFVALLALMAPNLVWAALYGPMEAFQIHSTAAGNVAGDSDTLAAQNGLSDSRGDVSTPVVSVSGEDSSSHVVKFTRDGSKTYASSYCMQSSYLSTCGTADDNYVYEIDGQAGSKADIDQAWAVWQVDRKGNRDKAVFLWVRARATGTTCAGLQFWVDGPASGDAKDETFKVRNTGGYDDLTLAWKRALAAPPDGADTPPPTNADQLARWVNWAKSNQVRLLVARKNSAYSTCSGNLMLDGIGHKDYKGDVTMDR